MVIGTHSLIADKVEFSALRIAVVDEQHRFGVIQRGRFNSKVFGFSRQYHYLQIVFSCAVVQVFMRVYVFVCAGVCDLIAR